MHKIFCGRGPHQAFESSCVSTEVSKPARGPSIQPGSYRDIERRTGIDKDTIRLAEQHVAAIAAHPEVHDAPQKVALDYAKTVAAHPAAFWLAESNIPNRRIPTDDLLLGPNEESHSLIADEVHGIPYTVHRHVMLFQGIRGSRGEFLPTRFVNEQGHGGPYTVDPIHCDRSGETHREHSWECSHGVLSWDPADSGPS